jgi:ferrochelatase
MKKVAIVLFNLGGPDSLKNVKDFLFNLFYDENIIRLPKPFRYIIAKLISTFRNNKSKKIYEQMGGKSPIYENTIEQQNSLKVDILDELKDVNIECFIAMRYFYPRAKDAAQEVFLFNPDEVVYLPLYPQYSTTTTKSSFDEFDTELKGAYQSLTLPIIKKTCCYYKNDLFINALFELFKEYLLKATKAYNLNKNNAIIFFSAHSLPEYVIKNGDPYEMQIKESVDLLMHKIREIEEFRDIKYKITYQSKVGPVKWLSPNTEDEIIAAAKKGQIIFVNPISFVSEHSETLVELDIDYKNVALDHGALDYIRIPTLSSDALFIKCLSSIVKELVENRYVQIKCEGFKDCYCALT